jgi:hypothetical protein
MKPLSLISFAFQLVGGAVIVVGLFTHGVIPPLLLGGGVLLAIGLLIKLVVRHKSPTTQDPQHPGRSP